MSHSHFQIIKISEKKEKKKGEKIRKKKQKVDQRFTWLLLLK